MKEKEEEDRMMSELLLEDEKRQTATATAAPAAPATSWSTRWESRPTEDRLSRLPPPRPKTPTKESTRWESKPNEEDRLSRLPPPRPKTPTKETTHQILRPPTDPSKGPKFIQPTLRNKPEPVFRQKPEGCDEPQNRVPSKPSMDYPRFSGSGLIQNDESRIGEYSVRASKSDSRGNPITSGSSFCEAEDRNSVRASSSDTKIMPLVRKVTDQALRPLNRSLSQENKQAAPAVTPRKRIPFRRSLSSPAKTAMLKPKNEILPESISGKNGPILVKPEPVRSKPILAKDVKVERDKSLGEPLQVSIHRDVDGEERRVVSGQATPPPIIPAVNGNKKELALNALKEAFSSEAYGWNDHDDRETMTEDSATEPDEVRVVRIGNNQCFVNIEEEQAEASIEGLSIEHK